MDDVTGIPEDDDLLKKRAAAAITTEAPTGTGAPPAIQVPSTQTLPHRAGIASLFQRENNIHNPFVRGLAKVGTGILGALDTAGAVVAPRVEAAIPGSTVNQAIKLKNTQAQQKENVHEGLEQAQTKEATARAHAYEAPPEKQGVTPEETTIHDLMTGENGQPRVNPQTKQPYTYLEAYQAVKQAGQDVKPETGEGKTVQTDQGVMQWNPDTKRYDIPVGAAPVKTPPHVTYDSGIPVSVTDGKKVYDVNDPNLPAELKPLVQSAVRAHGQHTQEAADQQARAFAQQEKMFGEREKAKNEDLTNTTKTMVEASPKVLKLAARVNEQIDKVAAELGPGEGRWSEFWAGKVGEPKPEYTKLRTDVGLLTTLLMRMHVGSRGGEYIMKHFQDLIDVGKQSPENLKAALGEIVQYAQDVQAEGRGGAENTVSGAATTFTVDGRTFKIPGDKVDAFRKKYPNAVQQ